MRVYAPRRAFRAGLRLIGLQSNMNLGVLVLVAVCTLTPACKGETMVSGKPVSHWVVILEDRDKREWFKAFDALRWCNKDDLKGARTRLRQMAVGGNIFSRNAALLLFDKFQEIDPKFADAYLVTNGDETYVRGGSAIIALARIDNSAASAAMLRKFEKMPDRGPLRTDIVRVANEIIAIRDGNS